MPFEFKQYGESGMDFASPLPHMAVSQMTRKIRSMVSGHNNHTGDVQHRKAISVGRPALGSWVSYGLGTANQNLPAYIVLRDERGYNTSGTLLWQNGWMPAIYGSCDARHTRAQSKIQRDSSRRSGSSNPELLAGFNKRFQTRIRRKVI